MLKSDEEYVLQAQKGNDVACEYILNKYKSIVRSASRTYFLLGGDSDDIVQEGMNLEGTLLVHHLLNEHRLRRCNIF